MTKEITQAEAVIIAFAVLKNSRTIEEIENWVNENYEPNWKDFGTIIADMVPLSHGGNSSSTVPELYKVLETTERGVYRLIV